LRIVTIATPAMQAYVQGEKLGEGTYATVHKVRPRPTPPV